LSSGICFIINTANILSQLSASPSSTQSEDVNPRRVRRKSFQRAQIALRSTSDQGSVSGVPVSGKPEVRLLTLGLAVTHLP